MNLPIPYRSQLADDAGYGKGDCGPSALAMILLAMMVYISVDALGLILKKPANYTITSLKELIGLAKTHFRITLELKNGITFEQVKAYIDARRAIIALVRYEYLPHRYDLNYQNGHYVTLIGYDGEYVYYHDPYYRNQAGAMLKCTWQEFSKAWSVVGSHADKPRYGLISPPIPAPRVEVPADGVRTVRWWTEEGERAAEENNVERVKQILLNEVIPRLYELEGVVQ